MPPLRKTVKIKFWSLRMELGAGLGVIFDVDTKVEREVYRVKTPDGWKWQVKALRAISMYDPTAETDQEIFDEYGSELEVEYA